MAWFNDIQSGIYNLVGMIDPSDPGYQGMMKAKYMDEHAKAQQEAIATSQMKRAIPTQLYTGSSPEGMKIGQGNNVANQLRSSMETPGSSSADWVKQNGLGMLLGGLSPADTAVGSLNPNQMAQYGKYATNLEMNPAQIAGNEIQKSNLERQDRGLGLQDKWHGQSLQMQMKQLDEMMKNRTENRDVNWFNADTHRMTALAGMKGKQTTPDDLVKAKEDLNKVLAGIQKVTGDPNSTMSIDNAITHASNNTLLWAVPAAKLIAAGQLSPDQLTNDLIASILNGGPADPNKIAQIKAKVSEVFGGSKNSNSSTSYDPKLEGMAPEAQTMAQQFSEMIKRGLGITPTFTSGYRNPEHNAAVGGVPNSLHTAGRAADMVIPGLSPGQEEMLRQMALKMGFQEALFHGEGDNHHFHVGY